MSDSSGFITDAKHKHLQASGLCSVPATAIEVDLIDNGAILIRSAYHLAFGGGTVSVWLEMRIKGQQVCTGFAYYVINMLIKGL